MSNFQSFFNSICFSASLILLSIWCVRLYNRVVVHSNLIQKNEALLFSEYQRRNDLISSLVDSVKSAKGFEKSTLLDVVQARKSNVSSKDFKALLESYPSIKSIDNYKVLMQDLKETENRIISTKNLYNNSIEEYNVLIQSFPDNIPAMILRYKKKEYLQTGKTFKVKQ